MSDIYGGWKCIISIHKHSQVATCWETVVGPNTDSLPIIQHRLLYWHRMISRHIQTRFLTKTWSALKKIAMWHMDSTKRNPWRLPKIASWSFCIFGIAILGYLPQGIPNCAAIQWLERIRNLMGITHVNQNNQQQMWRWFIQIHLAMGGRELSPTR